jgi:hypothetical protein
VEEYKFFEVATGKERLVEFLAPLLRRRRAEVAGKMYIKMPCSCSLAHTRRSPRDGVRICVGPLSYVGVVELVRRDEVADAPQLLKLLG